MIFDRLAIGTANWGKEYNGAKVSEDDQKWILDYCREVGIDMIDTATAYGWDWTKIDPWFKVVVKVREDDAVLDPKPYLVMAHSVKEFRRFRDIKSVSLYSPNEVSMLGGYTLKAVQVPYSIYDRRFEKYFGYLIQQFPIGKRQIYVRSVFLRGKILVEFEPHECITFCLMNPYVDRVILGADSFKQFKDNLVLLEEMCDSKKVDENLLDPRKWGKEEK